MRLTIFVAAFLAAASVQAAERSAVATGDWSDAKTWDAAVPGDGDSILVKDGVTVTVKDARVVGASGPNGTAAVSLGQTGALVIAKGGSLCVRGDVVYASGQANTSAAVTVEGGGAWTWDASKAAAPAETHYRFAPSGEFGLRPFVLAGAADARAKLDSDPAGGAGVFTRGTRNFAGPFKASFADLSRIGDDKTPGWDIGWSRGNGTSGVFWDVQDCLFTHCGAVKVIFPMNPDGVYRHSRNVHRDTQGKLVLAGLPAGGAVGKGVREITSNVFDVMALQNGFVDDYTISGNYFGGGFFAFYSSGPWAKCEGNFYRIFDQFCWVTGKKWSDAVIFIDRDWDNPHVLFPPQKYQTDAGGLIFSHAGTCNSDSGEWVFLSPGVHHSIFLPNIHGYSSGEMTANGGGAAGPYVYDHNTWFGGYGKGWSTWPGFSAFQYSETGNTAAGALKSFRSNLLWNPELPGRESAFVKLCDVHSLAKDQKAGPPVEDVGDPKNIDYNAAWNLQKDSSIDFPNKAHYKNWGHGYIGNWSRQPGEHDLDLDPEFVDYKRDVPLYATKCLGEKPTRGDWSATPDKPYAAGDTVLHSTEILWGLPVLYRYIGAGENPEPGLGTRKTGDAGKWRASWEWASLHSIREAIREQKKFNDGDAIMHLINWIRAGYAPTNPKLKGAAHDGGDIGAVPWQEKPVAGK